MPFIDDKLSIFLCKPLRLRQLSNLQTVRLPKLDILLDIEYWFASAVANMRMDRTVFVAVEEEPVAVPFKYLRHHKTRSLAEEFSFSSAASNLSGLARCARRVSPQCIPWRFRLSD